MQNARGITGQIYQTFMGGVGKINQKTGFNRTQGRNNGVFGRLWPADETWRKVFLHRASAPGTRKSPERRQVRGRTRRPPEIQDTTVLPPPPWRRPESLLRRKALPCPQETPDTHTFSQARVL